MKRKLLSLLLIAIAAASFGTTYTITNSGNTYSPATITISPGDSVRFNIGSFHDAVEVSEATWNANGNTALPGFTLPFGGGLLLPADLPVGTHYYVCTPHASLGMKGTIIVQGIVGISDNSSTTELSIFPNPSNGTFLLTINGSKGQQNYNLSIYDISGASALTTPLLNQKNNIIDLSDFPKGIYFLKIYNETELFTRKIVVK